MGFRWTQHHSGPPWRAIRIALCVATLLAIQSPPVHAAMQGFQRVEVDFTADVDRASWTGSRWASATTAGLGWDRDEIYPDSWFRTIPVAVGWAWRPTTLIHVRAFVDPAPGYALKLADRDTTYFTANIYARFSPDLLNWSSWILLQRVEGRTPEERAIGSIHDGEIRVPHLEQAEYHDWLSKYRQRDVPWRDDEEAAVRWIVSRDPRFFARHIPFIGYVEFLCEPGRSPIERIHRFRADISYGVGGISSAPKSGIFPKGNGDWRFRADAARSTVLYQPKPYPKRP